MATAASLTLDVWRNDEVYEFPLRVRGPDLTGVAMRAQVRLAADTPGAPLVDLALTANGNAEGIRLAGVTTVDGVITNDVRIRLNKSTRQALPYAGEIGDAATLAMAFQIAGRTRLYGNLRVLAHAIDSDAAPMNRPASYGARVDSAPSAGASLTIGADDVVELTIDGADLLGKVLTDAQDASAAAISAAAASEASAARAIAAVPIPVSKVFPTPVAVGVCSGGGTMTSSIGQVFAIGGHQLRRALLTGFKVNLAGGGTFAIIRAIKTNDANRHAAAATNASFSLPSGVSTVSFDTIMAANGGQPFILEIGDILGFAHEAGIKFTPNTREPFYNWPAGLGSGLNDTVLKFDADGATLDVEFYYRLADPVEPGEAIVDRCTTFGVVPATYIQNGPPFATDGAGAIVLRTGDPTQNLSTKRITGLDRMVYRAEFQFTSSTSHVMFATNPAVPVDGLPVDGILFTVDRETGKLNIYNSWDGSGAIPASDPADQKTMINIDGTAFAAVMNRTYSLVVEKLARDYRVSVIDTAGPSYYSTTVSDGGLYTYTATGQNTKHGLMHGAAVIAAVAGTAKLLSWQSSAPYDVFGDWLCIGDSKTEGFGVLAPERYSALLADKLGQRRVAISGVGGATTRGAIFRLFCILEAMQPRNILINLGTNPENDAEFAAGIALMIRMGKAVGATVYVATLASSAAKTAIVLASGAIPVRFGETMTTNGPGTATVPTLYVGVGSNGVAFNDGLHENKLGHQREFAQLMRDARM